MNGLAIMLKSFGLDPEAITSAVTDIRALILEFGARLERIETKLDALEKGNTANEIPTIESRDGRQ